MTVSGLVPMHGVGDAVADAAHCVEADDADADPSQLMDLQLDAGCIA